MKFTYKHTRYACYMAYITGAIINNFSPLLFVIFQRDFGISIIQLSQIISANFGIQLVVDFLSSNYVDKIGYRRTLIIALAFSFVGLVSLGTLPKIIDPFLGIMISVVFYAMGSGLLEVMVSPTIEGLPSDKKTSDMSILHSFYCWGCVLVIIASTIFFKFIAIDKWSYLCYLWALLPLLTMVMFFKVPIVPFGSEKGKTSIRNIFKSGMFRVFVIIMMCAGASEIAMSQWASLFAETGLGVTKTVGDLLGPCMFAISMGIARILFGKFGEKVDTFNVLSVSAVICALGYLIAVFSKKPIIALVGCAIVGLGSAVMWPGTLSLAAKYCPFGDIALFGLLAMSGDIGCFLGPTLMAQISERFSVNSSPLKAGLLCAVIFPAVLIICTNYLKIYTKRKGIEN